MSWLGDALTESWNTFKSDNQASKEIGTYNNKPLYSIPTGFGILGTKREDGDYYLKPDGSIGTWKNVVRDNDLLSAFISVATGGISDMVQGDPMFGAFNQALYDKGVIGSDGLKLLNVASGLGGSMLTFGLSDLTAGINKGLETGDVWAGIDRSIDPGGSVDYVTRGLGDIIYSISPEISQYLSEAGTAIGGAIGSYVPVIGTGVGAAIGSGIGSKLESGNRDYDYGGDFLNAGTSYLGGSAVQGIAPAVSNYLGGGIVGDALGGAASGATRSTLSSLPNAVESGNYNNLLTSALIGGAVGGVGGAFGSTPEAPPEGMNPLNSYIMGGAASPTYEQFAANALSGIHIPGYVAPTVADSLAKTYSSMHPSYTPFSVDPTLQLLPQLNPLDSFGQVQPMYETPTLNSQPISPEDVYLNAASEDMFYRPSDTPGEIGTLGKVYDKPPSIWDTIQDYASTFGKAVLDNSDLLKTISGGFTAAGMSGMAPGEFAGGSRSTPYTEWLSRMLNSGTGVGKSKGLRAGAVEGPAYDAGSFMPDNREISEYDSQGLYYT